MTKSFRTELYTIMKHYPKANNVLREIENCGEVLLLGGAVREFKESHLSVMPRDFDIVVDAKGDNWNLEAVLMPYYPKRNRFGGYKIIYKDLIIDIWTIENTWAFQQKKVVCAPNEYTKRLQDTVFLNIDSIVYNLTKDVWYDERYNEAIKNNILDIVLEENPQISLNIVRAIIQRRKYDMMMSERLSNFIGRYILENPEYINEFISIQKSHYNRVVLNRFMLEKELAGLHAGKYADKFI